jgi:hypothetical protein
MVTFNITVNRKQRTAYFNRKLIEALGYELGVNLNVTGGAIYPKDTDKREVIRSLKIVLEDLEHQADVEEKKKVESSSAETKKAVDSGAGVNT